MVSWSQFAAEDPELAEMVRAAFAAGVHATMATIRADSGPRISGTEVEFAEGEIFLGSGGGARKTADLLRDPRVAIHSPTRDPGADGSWAGEGKINGRVEVVDSPEGYPLGAVRFRVDLSSVVFTGLTDDRQQMHIRLWRPGRGRDEMFRT